MLLVTILVAAASLLQWRVAHQRSAGLLEHDEAIALLAAAGKSQLAEKLYEQPSGIHAYAAADIQSILRPTGTTLTDVRSSLAAYDIHPPLYFSILHLLQRCGIESHVAMRLFGTLVALLGALISDRFVWPSAAWPARVLGAAWLLLSPTCVEVATQLRQYCLIYLGTILTIAGLLRLNTLTLTNRLSSIILIAAGPIVLLYSQFGAVLWILIVFLAGFVMLRRATEVQKRAFGTGCLFALMAICPLLIWWWRWGGQIGPAPAIGLAEICSRIVGPLAESVGRAWISVPSRWSDLPWAVPVGLLIVAASGLLAWRRGVGGESNLWLAAIVWTAVWIGLITLGKVPPHAVSAKYLAPLVHVTLALIVRSAQAASPKWARCVVFGLLGCSILSCLVGDSQLVGAPRGGSIRKSIAQADALLINTPRRGYLLPLAAAMRLDAKIILAAPSAALASWGELESLLPADRLVLAEVFQERVGPALELFNRLEKRYGSAVALRREPARTVTSFARVPVDAAR